MKLPIKKNNSNGLANKYTLVPTKNQSKHDPLEVEDYDFDFSIYEQEEKEEINLESIKSIKENKPRITNYRSKFGNSIQEIEQLQNIKIKITEYAIKVGSYTEDMRDLWVLFGCLNEYWARIKEIFGTIIQQDIKKQQDEIKLLLQEYANKNKQNYAINEKLLELRDDIYLVSQRANLGIEVEKIYSSKMGAKQNIIE